MQNNAVDGAVAGMRGAVDISAGTVTNHGSGNPGNGEVAASSGGHAVVDGSSTSVSSNNGDGVLVVNGGSARISNGATVENNSNNGLSIVEGATAKMRQGAIVQGNGASGIYVQSGTVIVGDSAGPATIQNNKGSGIFLRTNSVAIFDIGGNQIVNNSVHGITVEPDYLRASRDRRDGFRQPGGADTLQRFPLSPDTAGLRRDCARRPAAFKCRGFRRNRLAGPRPAAPRSIVTMAGKTGRYARRDGFPMGLLGVSALRSAAAGDVDVGAG